MSTKNITLMMVDGGNVQGLDQTVKTLRHCSKMLPWGRIALFAHSMPTCDVSFIDDLIVIGKKGFWFENNMWHLTELPGYIKTTHALSMQNDGYILNPHLWNDEWLGLDYMGPPWPPHFIPVGLGFTNRVGSDGFAIKSKRFMEKSKVAVRANGLNHPLDVYQSNELYHKMKAWGLKYADVATAIKFGYEHPQPEFPGWEPDTMSFGFHGDWGFGRRVKLP